MNILVALPLLPLLGALWFAVTRRGDRRAESWVVALAAFFTIAVALLATSQDIEATHLLVRGRTAFALDNAARAALLLFGALWLAAALLARGRSDGPAPIMLLLGLSAAVTLAVARGGPLVFAAMLATGFGLYGIVASEEDRQWRGRLLVTLLVASDLLIFEALLHGTAHPGGDLAQGVTQGMTHGMTDGMTDGMTSGLALLVALALLLRSGMPPAHTWLPAALSGASAPAAILLAGIPAGAAFIGGRQLLHPAGTAIGTEINVAIVGLALAGALWSAFAAVRTSGSHSTLGYAAAMTAALLLVATPAIADTTVSAWAVVSLAACCAAVPVIGLQHDGWARSASITLVLASQGLAAAHAAVLATAGQPSVIGFLTALVAGSSTMLLAMALRRTGERDPGPDSAEAAAVALALGGLAAAGLWFLWRAGEVGFDSFWPAPAGITLGLLLVRGQGRTAGADRRQRTRERIVAAGRGAAPALREFCLGRLPRERDRLQTAVIALWRGEAWAERIARLELMLRQWPATGLLMLLVAIAAAALLAS
ncbi:proton-conducting transporter transmembrane domain-containing protein [Lentisalinibacter sediminis]|uniref:proton-conducting transporter transmembrane domain-containing protein n=1 Tax=Lentisalinibacter sediminis TaxID=2992237 RepID=UPI0038660DDB